MIEPLNHNKERSRYDALTPVDKAIEDVRQHQRVVRGMMSEGSLPPRFDDSGSVLAAEVIRLRADLRRVMTIVSDAGVPSSVLMQLSSIA